MVGIVRAKQDHTENVNMVTIMLIEYLQAAVVRACLYVSSHHGPNMSRNTPSYAHRLVLYTHPPIC